MEPRIRIFVGAYGSGKTEVAINHCFEQRKLGLDVAIADLDLVNPYFRSREMRQAFESQGIQVIAPEGSLSSADLPIIVPRVRGFIERPNVHLVLDVGGDDAGARALAQFATLIKQDPGGYDMSFVVNDRRPWTGTVQGLRDSIRRVMDSSHLQVRSLVSNPNLGDETTPEVVRKGHAFICDAARELGLPVVLLAATEQVAPELSEQDRQGVPLLLLTRHLFPPWYADTLRNAPYADPRARVLLREMSERHEHRLGVPPKQPE